MHHLGSTRSSLKLDHLLQTPDTFVRTPLPGGEGVEFVIHATPAMGARFTEMTAEFAAGGSLGPAPAQRFLYVLDGELDLTAAGARHILRPGAYAYLPQGAEHKVRATTQARAVIIEKPYEELAGAPAPEFFAGDESALPPVPLQGDEALRVCALMPEGGAWDFAVNTMTFDPGAALSMVA